MQSRNLLDFIPLAFGILMLAHIYLAAASIVKYCQYKALDNKWNKLQPQRDRLDKFKGQYDVLSSAAQAVRKLDSMRLNWSEKLNKLSLNLPSGVWFNELSVSRAEFVLRASVISLQKEEMALINKFINNLKNDAGFFKDFNNLEISLIQRKVIGGYDIVDFTLTGKTKPQ